MRKSWTCAAVSREWGGEEGSAVSREWSGAEVRREWVLSCEEGVGGLGCEGSVGPAQLHQHSANS